MKLKTIAVALAFTLPATFALAQAPMNLPGTEYRTTGVTVGQPGTDLGTGLLPMNPGTEFVRPRTGVTVGQTGRIAVLPKNMGGNTLGPIAPTYDPSGSTLTQAALVRGY